jgi:N-acetylneuraminic acid mutarotase
VYASWTSYSRLAAPEARQGAGAAVLDGTLYVVGGWLRHLTVWSDVWALNIAASNWTLLPIKNVPFRADGTLVVMRSKLYFYGGVTQFNNGTVTYIPTVTEIDVHTMAARTTLGSNTPPARSFHSAVAHNDSM